MDPDVALEELRSYVEEVNKVCDDTEGDGDLSQEDKEQLAELAINMADVFRGLDEWLSKKGFYPRDWRRTGEEKRMILKVWDKLNQSEEEAKEVQVGEEGLNLSTEDGERALAESAADTFIKEDEEGYDDGLDITIMVRFPNGNLFSVEVTVEFEPVYYFIGDKVADTNK